MAAWGLPALLATALVIAGLVLLATHVSIGATTGTHMAAIAALFHDSGDTLSFAVRALRLPRAVTALICGASLAISGAIIQALIRNPLGDPGLTGVTAGAAFGVAATLTLATGTVSALSTGAVPALAAAGILGGAGAALLTFLLARPSGFEPAQLILSGVAVSILFLALTSTVMILDRALTQTLYFWLIGGFMNRGWDDVHALLPFVAAGLVAGLLSTRALDLLAFDQATAGSLGLPVTRWRLGLGLTSVVLAAAPTAVAGPIAFIGFIAPHLVRAALGQAAPPHRVLLPLAALTGACLTLGADVVSRALPLERAPPAGAVVAVLGGAVFLALARRVTADRS